MHLATDERWQFDNWDAYLFHTVPIANCDLTVVLRLKVIRNAKRRPNFVMPPITLPIEPDSS